MTTHNTFKRDFTAGLDTSKPYRAIGWKPDLVPTFDYRTGAFSVAHDAMEHPIAIDGTLDNELLAHGAALYLRTDNDVANILGENLVWFYDQVAAGKLAAACAIEPTYVSDVNVDRKINAIIDVVSRGTVNGLTAYAKTNLHFHLAAGYRQAETRYAHIGRANAQRMAVEIDTAMNSLTPSARVGDRLIVTLSDAHAQIDLIEFMG